MEKHLCGYQNARSLTSIQTDIVQKLAGSDKYQYLAHLYRNRENLLTNAAGQPIIRVEKSTIQGFPNSITQKVNAKGGIDRNYYGPDGWQFKQVSNNGHGNKVEEAHGLHGEHAHDYTMNEKGVPVHGQSRELSEKERKENADFL